MRRIFIEVLSPMVLLVISSTVLPSLVHAQLTACDNPVYEGFGSATTGGKGKAIYRVTHLGDDTTVGSLRAALSQGDRCIVFDVAGLIRLTNHISTAASNITLDGFTAPSPGVTVMDYGILFRGSNVIIRGVRFRNAQGCETCPSFGNGIVIRGAKAVVDHVSIDGYGDQAMSVSRGGRDVTIQYSILGQAQLRLITTPSSFTVEKRTQPEIDPYAAPFIVPCLSIRLRETRRRR